MVATVNLIPLDSESLLAIPNIQPPNTGVGMLKALLGAGKIVFVNQKTFIIYCIISKF